MKKIILTALLLIGLFFTGSSVANEASYKTLKIFADVIDEIETNYVDEVDTNQLLQNAIRGMVKDLDPHSVYLLPEAYKQLRNDTRGEFSGIGIVMTTKDKKLTVIAPIEGTPAYKAGIKPGDVIVKINGVLTTEISSDEAIANIKGPEGSTITLTVMRNDAEDLITITMKREDIPMTSVKYALLKNHFLYVSISNFNEHTTTDLKQALAAAEKATTIKGMILDLRNNPGGLLKQAVMVSDLFIKNGTIVSIRGRDKAMNKSWDADPKTDKYAWPMTVLINDGTASAAEIVAGALQDHGRALIFGTTSFGKGSVQNITPLSDESALKLTVARYYTPSDKSIQALGISPDIRLQYQYIEDIEQSEPIFKEKDLKNHLEAEIKDKPAQAGKPLNEILIQNLKHDNQVTRALELLISHTIFADAYQN